MGGRFHKTVLRYSWMAFSAKNGVIDNPYYSTSSPAPGSGADTGGAQKKKLYARFKAACGTVAPRLSRQNAQVSRIWFLISSLNKCAAGDGACDTGSIRT